MNLYLIGYRGTGKTTTARLVAERLGAPWRDADVLLEERAGQTIRQIFAAEGEEGFRRRESEILRELATRDGWIIATGGGIILREENRALLRQGRVVWLTAAPEILWQRLRQDPTTAERRPNLTTGGLEEIQSLLANRTPFYEECADLKIDTAARSTEEAAALVVDFLRDRKN